MKTLPTPFRPVLLTGLPLLAVLVLSGCLNLKPVEDPIRYFTLSPLALPEVKADSPDAIAPAVGLRQVQIPRYLESPRLALRKGTSEIVYLDWLQWAEGLDRGLLRVLGANLSHLLHTERIYLADWQRESVDFQVQIYLTRFEPTQTGLVTLEAKWRIAKPGSRVPVKEGGIHLQKQGPAPAENPDGTVAAMNDLLNDFSRELARVLRDLAAAPSGT